MAGFFSSFRLPDCDWSIEPLSWYLLCAFLTHTIGVYFCFTVYFLSLDYQLPGDSPSSGLFTLESLEPSTVPATLKCVLQLNEQMKKA